MVVNYSNSQCQKLMLNYDVRENGKEPTTKLEPRKMQQGLLVVTNALAYHTKLKSFTA